MLTGTRTLIVLAGIAVFATGFAWGHGGEQHDATAGMQQHMQQMYQLKEQIPEEYRVMNRTPVVPDAASLDRGEDLFSHNCSACHGATGRGDGPAAGTLVTPPANFHDLGHSAIYGPGEKYWIIDNGSGKTGMPGFGKELAPKDRWDLVNHIYRLQKRE